MNTPEIKDQSDFYELLVSQAAALTEDERLVMPDLSNTAALLGESLTDINWAGYYLLRGDVLILGPFWGRPACIRIPLGKGVCGTAWEEGTTLVVPDVHAFPGHIACDSASNAEIVIPIHDERGSVAGVLDIDSPLKGRFTQEDREGLELFVRALEEYGTWKS